MLYFSTYQKIFNLSIPLTNVIITRNIIPFKSCQALVSFKISKALYIKNITISISIIVDTIVNLTVNQLRKPSTELINLIERIKKLKTNKITTFYL